MICLEIKNKGWHNEATKIGMPQSKGFIWGPLVAKKLGMGCFMLRKPGKLPLDKVAQVEYTLQYAVDALQFLPSVMKPKEKVLVIDDCMATGGKKFVSNGK
jgi:adenine phosphoribosyltransferase